MKDYAKLRSLPRMAYFIPINGEVAFIYTDGLWVAKATSHDGEFLGETQPLATKEAAAKELVRIVRGPSPAILPLPTIQ